MRAHGADDDDAVLPIWSGRIPEADPEKVKFHSARLGGKTLGEELGELLCELLLCELLLMLLDTITYRLGWPALQQRLASSAQHTLLQEGG